MADWSRVARRIRVPLGFAFAMLYIWLARPTWLTLVTGLVVAIPGLLLRALASGHVRKNEALTTTGPYAYTRNPLYLGSLIIGLGFVIAARNWWIAGAMAALFFAIYIPVIRAEENYLRSTFPEFDNYAKQVPRLLLRFPKTSQKGAFSGALYRQHREYNAILGAIAVTAILLAKLAWFGKH